MTAALLAERPLADIRVTEIARAAGIAQPNFYTYFANIEEAVLALARETSFDTLTVYLDHDWDGEPGMEHARRLVEAALEVWGQHKAVFAIVNVLADQRRGEFAAVRVQAMRSVYKAFEAKIAQAQAAGRLSKAITPRLAGYECISVLSSMSLRYQLMMASGFNHEQVVETTARLLHLIATGG